MPAEKKKPSRNQSPLGQQQRQIQMMSDKMKGAKKEPHHFTSEKFKTISIKKAKNRKYRN